MKESKFRVSSISVPVAIILLPPISDPSHETVSFVNFELLCLYPYFINKTSHLILFVRFLTIETNGKTLNTST